MTGSGGNGLVAPTKVWRSAAGLWFMKCRVCGWAGAFGSFAAAADSACRAAVMHDGLPLRLSRAREAGWDVS